MEKIFVDTSAWVALFVANDKNHKKAVSVFDELKSSRAPIYTSDYCIDETITTILVRGDHRQSVLAGEALLTSKIIKIAHVSSDCFNTAWELYRKYKDKTFSFTDVTSFAIMKDIGIRKAFSYDIDFTQAGFEAIG